MEWSTTRLRQSLTTLPPATAAAAAMYGSAVVLLVGAAITWEPGKNPRWVIASLAVVALAFVLWALSRGRWFTPTEALMMVVVQLATIGSLTWTTHLTIGAFANGTVLPIVGVYTIWFLHPVAGRVVLYLGALGWFVAVLHQGSSTIIPFAISLIVQTVVATELFARIKQRMDRLAHVDPLTGVLNRRGITELLERELARAERHRQPLSVVAVDLDGLREVNNSRGHRAGDQLLQSMTSEWAAGVRSGDAIGRVGGDEFVFVLPGSDESAAETIVQRLTEASSGGWSAGIAAGRPGDTMASLLERADRRLYVAKTTRRTA